MNRKFLSGLVAVLLLSMQLRAQLIFTIVGNGVAGYNGEMVLEDTCRVNHPRGLDVSPDNYIYFADEENNRVRVIDPWGMVRTVAGDGVVGSGGDGGPAVAARLFKPFVAKKDNYGNIYISDSWNSRIRKVRPDGVITTFAGVGSPGFSGDGGPATAAQLDLPGGIAFDTLDNVYIADANNNRIRRVNVASGIITTVVGTGTGGYSGDGGPASLAEISNPLYLAMDKKGNLFFPDNQNHVVRKVDTAGVISTVAGNGIAGYSGNGGLAIGAQLRYPGGVSVDKIGQLYIADHSNSVIRQVDTFGIITTVAGTGVSGYSGDWGPATNAQLDLPYDVLADNYGNILIADYYNDRIRKLQLVLGEHDPQPAGSMSIGIAPNPSDGKFTVFLFGATRDELPVSVIDVVGATVARFTMRGNESRAIVTDLPPGVYIVRADMRNGVVAAKLLIGR